MKLELENVGKISSANIELNGITVIAGENNTGKSTIGKMLFCVFHAFYKMEEQIRKERARSIARVISSYYQEAVNRITRSFDTMGFAEHIVDQQEIFLADTRLLAKEIGDFYKNKDKDSEQYMNQDSLEKVAKRIHEYLDLEDREIRKTILQKRLEAEFAMKVGNLNDADQRANVKLSIKNDCIDFSVIGNEEIIISNHINLNKEIIYMDDPFILDDLESLRMHIFGDEFEHRNDLLKKLLKNKRTGEFSVVDELIVKKKLEGILNKICDVCDGNLMSEDGVAFVYKTDKLNGDLNMANLSTGMKSFVILRRLLQNGNIDENGMMILDEPEIHLHPEWQLKFAEIIVLIQKEFRTNILLNTHSPYFLNAIEVYSEKYKIDHSCNYYLATEENGIASITDVTNETERIYAKLAKPLQELENMEYGNTKV